MRWAYAALPVVVLYVHLPRWLQGDTGGATPTSDALWFLLWVALPIGAAFTAALLYHDKHLCTSCNKMPSNGQRSAQRWHNVLWLYHFGAPMPSAPVWTALLWWGTVLAAGAWQFWWTPASAICVSMCCFTVAGGLLHRRLKPWCPWCQHDADYWEHHQRCVLRAAQPSQTEEVGRIRADLEAAPGAVRVYCYSDGCDGEGEYFLAGEHAASWLDKHLDLLHFDSRSIRIAVEMED